MRDVEGRGVYVCVYQREGCCVGILFSAQFFLNLKLL